MHGHRSSFLIHHLMCPHFDPCSSVSSICVLLFLACLISVLVLRISDWKHCSRSLLQALSNICTSMQKRCRHISSYKHRVCTRVERASECPCLCSCACSACSICVSIGSGNSQPLSNAFLSFFLFGLSSFSVACFFNAAPLPFSVASFCFFLAPAAVHEAWHCEHFKDWRRYYLRRHQPWPDELRDDWLRGFCIL